MSEPSSPRSAAEAAGIFDRLRPNHAGLVPAVVQDASTEAVLMLAWMDREALRRTLVTGRATYWSRSRQEYWVKGETSGHSQQLVSVRLDCDGDTLLLRVNQTGPACHTGTPTCFDQELPLGAAPESASARHHNQAGESTP